MAELPAELPEIHMPPAEAEALRAAYREARVIGEYGAGGSTAFAALECSARVLSIESDPNWIGLLRDLLDSNNVLPGRVELRHCDIGPTAAWGHPSQLENWPKFWRYPYALWQDPDFNPDIVLIEGRFRAACLAACMIFCRQPLTVLFDDYTDRREYHRVEEILPRAATIGRMVRFEVQPGRFTPSQFASMVPWFFSAR